MRPSPRQHLPALLCVLAFPLCALLVHPFFALPYSDDWSYTRTAQLLAQTGHMHYNGWGSPILLWQAAYAALLIKLFGFSFQLVRAGTLVLAVALAWLMQRSFVRSGLEEWHAAFGTLAVLISPLSLTLAFTYMTDIPAMFSTVLCYYACLRCLQAASDATALRWIAFAALSSAIGGTGRQTAWLGVLVMVPCTLWLLRRRRPSLIRPTAVLYVVSLALVIGTLQWYNRQPFAEPEHIFPSPLNADRLAGLRLNLTHAAFTLPVALLPVLCVFVPALWRNSKRGMVAFAAFTALWLLYSLHRIHIAAPIPWIAPYLPNFLYLNALWTLFPVIGVHAVLLIDSLCLLITLAAILSILYAAWRPALSPQPSALLSWHQLAVLIGPFTLAYICLLLPSGAYRIIFDRYLIPLVFVAVPVLLRYAQERVPTHTPARISLALIVPVLLSAAWSILSTHDTFAVYHARVHAIDELRSAGIPPSAIDGGFEYNAWTQLQSTPAVNDVRLPTASAETKRLFALPPQPCQPAWFFLFPDLHPRYALSTERNTCGAPAPYPPVPYQLWIGARTLPLHIIYADAPPSTSIRP
jgi:hypothetical protein